MAVAGVNFAARKAVVSLQLSKLLQDPTGCPWTRFEHFSTMPIRTDSFLLFPLEGFAMPCSFHQFSLYIYSPIRRHLAMNAIDLR